MTEKDARIARKVVTDELDTINAYSAMAENADSEKVKDVLNDIVDEEKVHVGEAAALLDENDPRAKPAMLEGVEEVGSFKESVKQTYFSPYTGKLQAKPPKVGDAGEPHHTRWEDLSEEMKKKTNPERYERELREHNTRKKASASFRDVFDQKRREVIAKANGDRYHVNEEGEEWEETNILPGSDEEAPEYINDASQDLADARAKKKKGKKKTKVRHEGTNAETKGLTDRGDKKGPKKKPEEKGQQSKTDLKDDSDVEAQYAQGEIETKPRESVSGMSRRSNRIDYGTRDRNAAGQRLKRHPDPEKVKERVKTTNGKPNDIPSDPSMRSVEDSNERFRRIENEARQNMPSAVPPLIEGHINSQSMNVKDDKATEEAARFSNISEKTARWAEDIKNIDREIEMLNQSANEIPVQDFERSLVELMEFRKKVIDAYKEQVAEIVRNMRRKKDLTIQNNAKGRQVSEKKQQYLKEKAVRDLFEENEDRKDITVKDETDKSKKASIPSGVQGEEHIEKGGSRNFGKEQAKRNADKETKTAQRSPYMRQFLRRDPTDRGPEQRRSQPNKGNPMRASGTLVFTPDLEDFSMAEYARYNTMGGKGRPLPRGSHTDEDYETLYGGVNHQIMPVRRQVKDSFGNPVYKTRRVPVQVMVDGHPDYVIINGVVKPNYKTDEYGNIIYTTVSTPVYEFVSNLILTREGKDLAKLQRYVGRLDYEWDEKTQQHIPKGIKLDSKGRIPVDRMYAGITDANGVIDPDKAMENLRELGYSGQDNRYVEPDISKYIDEYYRRAAYQQLVEKGVFGPEVGKDMDSLSPEGQRRIDERAAEIRELDDELRKGILERDAEARQIATDIDLQIQEEAQTAAKKALQDWLNKYPYEMKDGAIIRTVEMPGRDEPLIQKWPLDTVLAWLDSNTIAYIEDRRRENAREASKAETQEIKSKLAQPKYNKIIATYGLRLAEAENPALTPEQRGAILDDAEGYATSLSPEDRLNLVKTIGTAFYQATGKMVPDTPDYLKMLDNVYARDWAKIQQTMKNLPYGVHVNDIYRQSQAHKEDLERMKADTEATRHKVVGQRGVVDLRNNVTNEANRLANEDESLHALDMAISDLSDKRNRAFISVGDDGELKITYNGADPSRGALIEQTVKDVLAEKGIDPKTFSGSSDPTSEIIRILKESNKEARGRYWQAAAENLGISPEDVDDLKLNASEAESAQARGGNTGHRYTDEEIMDMFDPVLDNQGAPRFGPEMDRDLFTDYEKLLRGESIGDEAYDDRAVRERVLGDALKKIRRNLVNGDYRKRWIEENRRRSTNNPAFASGVTDTGLTAKQEKDLYYLDKLFGGLDTSPSGEDDDLRRIDVLERLINGKALQSDPHFSYDFERMLRNHLNRELKDAKRKDIKEALMRIHGPKLREILTTADTMDAGQVSGKDMRADTVPLELPTLEDIKAATAIGHKLSPLKNEMNGYVTILQSMGLSDEEIKESLEAALIAGKGKKFDMTSMFGKPKTGTVTSDFPVKEPDPIPDGPGRRDSTGRLLGLTEENDSLPTFDDWSADEVEEYYNWALDYVMDPAYDPNDPKMKEAWSVIDAVDNELRNNTSPGAEKGQNGLQMFRSRLQTQAILDAADRNKAEGKVVHDNGSIKDRIHRWNINGTGAAEKYGNNPRGASGDTPLTVDKPLGPNPDEHKGANEETKTGGVNEDEVNATSETKHKEQSFRDVFSQRRDQVLKKYHGI